MRLTMSQVNSYAAAARKGTEHDKAAGARIRTRNSTQFQEIRDNAARSFTDGIISYCTSTTSRSGKGEISMRRISEALATAGLVCWDGSQVSTGQVGATTTVDARPVADRMLLDGHANALLKSVYSVSL